MVSVGLAVGCGDDGSQTSQTGTGQPTTMSAGSTTVDSVTATTVDMTGTSAPPPTTSEGSGSMTSDSGTTVDTSTSTGMVTATMGMTSTVSTTDAMTTDISASSTGSTSNDTTSTSTSTTDGSTSGEPGSSSSTTNAQSSTTMDVPCDEIKVTLTPVVPNVMLVLDKSGSMLTLWDHDANANTATVTRWYSLWAVVDQVLTAFQADFNFGMNLFPSKSAMATYTAAACPVNGNVEVTVKPNNKAAIIAALPAQNNNTIKGGTPAAAGMTSALNHLKTLDPMVPRVAMLITDGAANCGANLAPPPLFEMYDQTLHTIVGNAFTMDDIPTYVIGIAIANAVSPDVQDGNPNGINPYDKLNELATLGGTAKPGPEKFYNADNQIELAAALNAIVSDAQSCVIALDVEPGFPDFTKVKINGAEIPKIMNCANENGWKYVDPAPPYVGIELCGTACNTLKMTGEADVEYYCMPG